MKTPEDIRIFLFHRVSESTGRWAHATRVSVFEKCVRYISDNFIVKSVEELMAMQLKEISHATKPFACITFDDGFKDNIKYALPVLEKYKCPASFYIVTDCIDSGMPTWPHLVQNLFVNTNKYTLKIEAKYVEGGINEKFSSEKERISYGDVFLRRLLSMPSAAAAELFNRAKEYFGDVRMPENLMMTWDEVKQLFTAGYVIGSHTMSHPVLSLLEDDDKVREEFSRSGEHIKKVCGKFPETIAYPLGIANERIMKLAKECGYKYGLTVEQRSYIPGTDGIMAIPRIDMFADSNWLKTYLRLTGHLGTIKKALGR
ncbi:MAG TPA: polysaccharide deacetylase family protein [Bacteroidia bacterium]|jgi:peptidoglycan/xylan/chitin deacetylase (PgdA/CDA1 family)|nr:polysaccharide deacetylase family protein [Bacteroidia bacterium]